MRIRRYLILSAFFPLFFVAGIVLRAVANFLFGSVFRTASFELGILPGTALFTVLTFLVVLIPLLAARVKNLPPHKVYSDKKSRALSAVFGTLAALCIAAAAVTACGVPVIRLLTQDVWLAFFASVGTVYLADFCLVLFVQKRTAAKLRRAFSESGREEKYEQNPASACSQN